MYKRMAVALAATALLAGCATAPASYDVVNTRVIPADKDTVWPRVVEFFATNNLSIKTIEKDSGIVAAERSIGRPGVGGSILGWADCGTDPLAVPTAQTADLNVFVRPQGAGTAVTVNTRFQEVRYSSMASSSLTVSCNSTGLLEGRILDAAASGN